MRTRRLLAAGATLAKRRRGSHLSCMTISLRLRIATARAIAAALAASALAAPALAQQRNARPSPPPHFGPSYQSPYQFAPPAPIFPTPGGSLYDTPYQGTDAYRRGGDPPAASSRSAPPLAVPRSQRLDTRIGPLK